MYRLYIFKQEEVVTDDFIDYALGVLPEERRKKALCYHNLLDRANCVISYLMLKIALREHFGVTYFSLRYKKSGKPYLAEYPEIFFNISHCMYGCAVIVSDKPVGVDIQHIVPFSWDIAKKVCCNEELENLEQSSCQSKDFVRMWAMKESYVKMTGQGIGFGMK